MSEGITLRDAIDIFEDELGYGNSPTARPRLLRAIQEGIEYMLSNGGGSILREWTIGARNGYFTFPRDLQTPIKYRIGGQYGSPFGIFHSGYLPYTSHGYLDNHDSSYIDWNPQFYVPINKAATQFPPPSGGVRLICTTRDPNDVGKKIMVAGKNNGREIAPMHNNFKTAGELLTVYLESDPHKKYSAWKFDEITGVVRDTTCSYTMLSGINESRQQFFLSHYHPDEEVPQYTVGNINTVRFPLNCDFELNIVGRISPSMKYTRDEEILPINRIGIITFLAKRAKYDESGNYQEVAVQEARIRDAIRKEIAYDKKPGEQISVALASSGYTLTNI